MFKKLYNVLRPSNFMGIWDITELLYVGLLFMVIFALVSPLIFVEAWDAGLVGDKQTVSIAARMSADLPIPEKALPEPYCLSSDVVVWGNTYYVAHPGMRLSNEAVKEWYATFFFDKLGYAPEDIRPLAGVDGSTDSRYTHYIDAWNGQIYIDHIPCK